MTARDLACGSELRAPPVHRDGWLRLDPLVSRRDAAVDDPGDMLPETQHERRLGAAWRRLLHDEEGIALVLAILIMLVLTISADRGDLPHGRRRARRAPLERGPEGVRARGVRHQQRARSAERQLPGDDDLPGRREPLAEHDAHEPRDDAPGLDDDQRGEHARLQRGPEHDLGRLVRRGHVHRTSRRRPSPAAPAALPGRIATGATVARATASGTSSVTWSGTLVNVPANPNWKWQWELTAFGRVKNPTGPAADVVRKATAVVPVVIPDSTSVPPGTTATDWIYGLNDVTFGQSVNVAAPVYAGHDLILANTATIAETIPASLTLPARPNRIVVGHDLSLVNPQNQVGHVNGSADPANDLAEIHVGNQCASKANATPHACAWGSTDKIWGVTHDNVIPPRPTHDADAHLLQPRRLGGAGRRHVAPGARRPPSYMGFWYLNAGLGPKSPCATSSGTPPKFDTVSGTADNTINESAYPRGSPVRSHRRRLQLHVGGRPDEAGVGRDHRSRSRAPSSSTAARRARPDSREVRRQGDDHPQRALLDGQQHRAVREPLGQQLQHERARGTPTPPPSRSSPTGSILCAADRATASTSRRGTSRGCSSATGTSSGASRAPSSSARWSASTGASTPARAARSSSRRSPSRRRARTD